ncbi:Claudin-10 Oligodendrocyte-specific protein-like [Triplophysa tibetana]|uniref:Claudin-10 Oligodendrocyte-specific protein-like n=1 Tax=Triplophysa tibetana TaxID=1572043 RepID=A0A5A9NWQ6_9TELE|nr:Claudin-10 Oligodendrocyte-specific protein-like [Triplophysa tibetana]
MSNMATEIVAFVLSVSGWILVSSTLPTDYWKVSSVDGTVITTATFWSNLWKTCVTDSTGVSNCKDFPSMLALDAYIQVCRGLMISAVCLGFFGAILALIGMKCTKIGGTETTKARITCLCGLHFILSGICSMTACSLYAHRITNEFFDPLFVKQKFELGAALFIGWAGSVLSILGGSVFCFSMTEGFSIREYSYNGETSFISTQNKVTKITKTSEVSQADPPDQIRFSGRRFGKNALQKNRNEPQLRSTDHRNMLSRFGN